MDAKSAIDLFSSNAQANTFVDADASPDNAARALKLQTETGTPAPVIQLDLESFANDLKKQKNSDAVATNPDLATFVNSNPVAAQAANDDFEKLDGVSKALRSMRVMNPAVNAVMSLGETADAVTGSNFGQGFQRALLEQEKGRLGNLIQLGATSPMGRIEEIKQQLTLIEERHGVEGWVQRAGSFFGGFIDNFNHALAPAVVGAGMGAVAGSVTGPGAVVTAPTGAAAGFLSGLYYGTMLDMARVSAGNAYLALNDVKDAKGNVIPEPTKQIFAIINGLATYAVGAAGARFLTPEATAAANSLVNLGLQEAIKRPAVQTGLLRAGNELLKAGVTGAGLNIALVSVNEFTDQLAKIMSSGEFETVMNNPKERERIIDTLTTAAVDGFTMFPLMHGASLGANKVMDRLRVKQVEIDALAFDDAMKAAFEARTRDRSPEAFKAFVEVVDPDGVFSVPAERVAEIYQSLGIEVPRPGDGVLGFVPDINRQMAVALQTGGDIKISLPDYMAAIDPKVDAALRPHVRLRDESLTPEEVKEFAPKKDTNQQYGRTLEEVQAALEANRTGLDMLNRTRDDVERVAKETLVKNEDASGLFKQADEIKAEGERLAKERKALLKEKRYYDAMPKGEEANLAATATAEVLRSERDAMFLDPLFLDPESAGMTPIEFKRYDQKLQKVTELNNERIIAAAKKEAARRNSKEWKDNLERVTAQVEAEFLNRPDMMVDEYMRTGKLPNGEKVEKTQLSTEAVRELLGKTGEKQLPAGTVGPKGVHPDEIAPLFGYQTGWELVRDLYNLEKGRREEGLGPAAHRNKLVKEESVRQMEAEYGILEENIIREAREAAIVETQADLLADEMVALARRSGARLPFTREIAERDIAEKFAATPIKQAGKMNQYARQVGQAGRKAELALLKGDYAEAFIYKQQQFLAYLEANEAKALQKQLRQGYRLFERFHDKTVTNVEQAYTDQIHRIMDQFGYGNRRQAEELSRALQDKDLKTFVLTKNHEGADIAVANFLLDPTWSKKFEDLTAAEFVAVKDSVQSLAFRGREEQYVEAQGQKALFNTIKDEMKVKLETLPPRFPEGTPRPGDESKYRLQFDASNLKAESLFLDLDGQDPSGPFQRYIYRGIKEAEHAETKGLTALSKVFREMQLGDRAWMKTLDQAIKQDFIIDPQNGKPMKLQRQDLLWIAANFGNRSNLEAVTRAYGNTPAGAKMLEYQIKDLLNRELTKKDWAFVESMWGVFKELRPQIDSLYREVSGVAPDYIKPEPMDTAYGQTTGGYFPLIYDKLNSNIETIKAQSAFDVDYIRATTPKGYTKSRAEGFTDKVQLRMDLGEMAWRVQQEIHDITHRRAIMQASKFIYDKELNGLIKKHYGPEYAELLAPWLKDLANGFNKDERAVHWMTKLSREIRSNLVVAVLGLNPKIVASPETGMLLASPEALKTGLKMFSSRDRMDETFAFAFEKSQELQSAQFNSDRDFRSILVSAIGAGRYKTYQAEAARIGFGIQNTINSGFRTITWMTEYKRALGENKLDAEAVAIADSKVRQYHGSNAPSDLPSLMRQGEYARNLTMFMGTFNMWYQQQRHIKRETGETVVALREGRNRDALNNATMALARTVAFVMIPTLQGAWLFNKAKEDDSYAKIFAKAFIGQMAGSLVFARDAWNYLSEGYDPRHPMMSAVHSIAKGAKDVAAATGVSDDNVSDKWLQNAIATPGYLFGLPTVSGARTAQFLYDLRSGDQSASTIPEFWRGIVHGKSQPD